MTKKFLITLKQIKFGKLFNNSRYANDTIALPRPLGRGTINTTNVGYSQKRDIYVAKANYCWHFNPRPKEAVLKSWFFNYPRFTRME